MSWGKESIVTLEMKNYAQDTSDICDLCMGTGIYDDGHIPEGGDEPGADGLCINCGGILMETCYRCNGTGINEH